MFKDILKTMTSRGNAIMNKAGFRIKQKSPDILFALGVAGFVGTVVMACKKGTKTQEILTVHRNNLEDLQTAMEMDDFTEDEVMRDKLIFYSRTAVDLTKTYAPVAALGALSIACFLASRNILNKRYLAAVSAYNGLLEVFRAYRKRVVDEYGIGLDQHFRYGTTYSGIEKEIVDEKGKKKKIEESAANTTTDQLAIADLSVVFDESNPGKNWTNNRSLNMLFLKAMETKCTDILRTRGHLFLNEVYDFLGFEHTQAGAVTGWVLGKGDDYVSFGLYEPAARNFVNGSENTVLLQFNHDGIIFNDI